MAQYRNISAKRIFVSGVQTIVTEGLEWVYPANQVIEPGETGELTEADATMLADRVELVEGP